MYRRLGITVASSAVETVLKTDGSFRVQVSGFANKIEEGAFIRKFPKIKKTICLLDKKWAWARKWFLKSA
jgi:hypothetical protein